METSLDGTLARKLATNRFERRVEISSGNGVKTLSSGFGDLVFLKLF